MGILFELESIRKKVDGLIEQEKSKLKDSSQSPAIIISLKQQFNRTNLVFESWNALYYNCTLNDNDRYGVAPLSFAFNKKGMVFMEINPKASKFVFNSVEINRYLDRLQEELTWSNMMFAKKMKLFSFLNSNILFKKVFGSKLTSLTIEIEDLKSSHKRNQSIINSAAEINNIASFLKSKGFYGVDTGIFNQ